MPSPRRCSSSAATCSPWVHSTADSPRSAAIASKALLASRSSSSRSSISTGRAVASASGARVCRQRRAGLESSRFAPASRRLAARRCACVRPSSLSGRIQSGPSSWSAWPLGRVGRGAASWGPEVRGEGKGGRGTPLRGSRVLFVRVGRKRTPPVCYGAEGERRADQVSWKPESDEIERRREQARAGGGVEATAKQRARVPYDIRRVRADPGAARGKGPFGSSR